VGEHRASVSGSAALRLGAGLAIVLLVIGLMVYDARQPETEEAQDAGALTTQPSELLSPPPPEQQTTAAPQEVVTGQLLLRKRKPLDTTPRLAPETDGRVGTGTVVGALSEVNAPVGVPVTGTVTTAVANLPDRTANGPFAGSIRTLVSAAPDFVMLQEVARRGTDELRSLAPGYDAYRDEDPDGAQSLNNVVLWREAEWTLVDAGRVKLLNDDRGFLHGRAFTWDRYATWATLQRADGAVVSVISTHLPTNPRKYPQQHGNPGMSRAALYGTGMDVLRETVRVLATHGPVLVGGDMNSHPGDGPWAAAPKMTAMGYGYAKDNGVMYIFYPPGADLLGHRVVGVASDHPAIVSTLDLTGLGPTAS
jgi:endonuclease/exonuclease/phosphatase family metal-dependent hydrolase